MHNSLSHSIVPSDAQLFGKEEQMEYRKTYHIDTHTHTYIFIETYTMCIHIYTQIDGSEGNARDGAC